MFKFSTNTIINSVTVPGFAGITASAGSAQPDEMQSHLRFYVDKAVQDNPVLRIAKHFKFSKNNVVAVYKRRWEAPQTFKVVFDLSTIVAKYDDPTTTTIEETSGTGRIALYVRLSGSQNSYYSNDFVFKGKPFFIEFPIKKGDTTAILAKRIARVGKKYQNMVYEYPQLKVFASKADGTVSTIASENVYITVAGTDEYQTIRMAKLEWYNPSAQSYDCCASFGDFQEEDSGTLVTQGHESFGTYRQMIKDLRVPTAANTRWNRIALDETPIFGGHYNEYLINMCVNRGIMGSDAVGEVTKSLTTHIFYVLDDGTATAFETALKDAGITTEDVTNGPIAKTIDKDYDDAVQIPEDKLEASFEDPAATIQLEKDASTKDGTKFDVNTVNITDPDSTKFDKDTGTRKPKVME